MKLRGGQDTEAYSQVRGRTSKSCDDSQKLRGGQQEAEGGEVTASRMRHALPEAVIHLHTDYASMNNQINQIKSLYTYR